MKVTIEQRPTNDNWKNSHRKENNLHDGHIVIDPTTGRKAITANVYYTSGMQVTSCVWLHCLNRQGSASVSGGGYHKASAAIDRALENCNVVVTGLQGVGETAIQDALLEIARQSGVINPIYVKSNG